MKLSYWLAAGGIIINAGLFTAAYRGVGARFPSEASEFTPPPEYATWWNVTKQCSGISADIRSVRWYTRPGYYLVLPPDATSDMEITWFASSRRMFVPNFDLVSGGMIRHAMLHALLGTKGHPAEYFVRRCGGVIVCAAECASKRDTRAVAGARVVPVDDLTVTATILPGTVIPHSAGGWFIVTTAVTNPFGTPVWVKLRRSTVDSPSSETFGAEAHASFERLMLIDGDSVRFGPHETKRYPFDWSASSLALAAGVHTVRPFFNIDTGAAVSFRVAP